MLRERAAGEAKDGAQREGPLGQGRGRRCSGLYCARSSRQGACPRASKCDRPPRCHCAGPVRQRERGRPANPPPLTIFGTLAELLAIIARRRADGRSCSQNECPATALPLPCHVPAVSGRATQRAETLCLYPCCLGVQILKQSSCGVQVGMTGGGRGLGSRDEFGQRKSASGGGGGGPRNEFGERERDRGRDERARYARPILPDF